MSLYKKTIPIHTSKKEKTSGESVPNNSEDVQTNSDNNLPSDNYNPNTIFRKGFSLFGNSIVSGAKKVQTATADFNTFCGGYSPIRHPWLKPYYDKYKGNSDYAIQDITSEGDEIVVIQFKSGRPGEYNRKRKELEKDQLSGFLIQTMTIHQLKKKPKHRKMILNKQNLMIVKILLLFIQEKPIMLDALVFVVAAINKVVITAINQVVTIQLKDNSDIFK